MSSILMYSTCRISEGVWVFHETIIHLLRRPFKSPVYGKVRSYFYTGWNNERNDWPPHSICNILYNIYITEFMFESFSTEKHLKPYLFKSVVVWCWLTAPRHRPWTAQSLALGALQASSRIDTQQKSVSLSNPYQDTIFVTRYLYPQWLTSEVKQSKTKLREIQNYIILY